MTPIYILLKELSLSDIDFHEQMEGVQNSTCIHSFTIISHRVSVFITMPG